MATQNFGYHRTIRKMIVAFGDIFNSINLSRYDDQGVEKEKFLVPIVYGGKEKYVSRLEGDPNLDKKVQITLPIMAYELVNMTYDKDRKLNTNVKNTYANGGATNTTLAVYNPVPFDFHFKLYAYVRNIEDGAQLMEKILPYFTPDYTINVNLVPEMGIIKQIPIVLKDVSNEVDYEGDYSTSVRSVIWTLDFTVKGYLYGPIIQPKIIRTSITNVLNDITLKDTPAIFTMDANTGFYTYKTGEVVYQGYSYDTSTAIGEVSNWNNNTHVLTMVNMVGHFITGQPIIGLSTNANWTPISGAYVKANLASVTANSNPSNVILPNNYTYTITTVEYPKA